MLELDHVFCFVDPAGDWRERIRAAGWKLDDGIEHPGQGTRNQRLVWAEQYLELVWLSSRADAEHNVLRLDRRADWRRTGASPFGIGLRGQLPEGAREPFFAYEPPYAPGVRIWVHRDEDAPLLFVMEVSPEQLPAMRARMRPNANPGALRAVRVSSPAAALPLLGEIAPPVAQMSGGHRMELVVDGPALEITDVLATAPSPGE